jgi:hypothetical protein
MAIVDWMEGTEFYNDVAKGRFAYGTSRELYDFQLHSLGGWTDNRIAGGTTAINIGEYVLDFFGGNQTFFLPGGMPTIISSHNVKDAGNSQTPSTISFSYADDRIASTNNKLVVWSQLAANGTDLEIHTKVLDLGGNVVQGDTLRQGALPGPGQIFTADLNNGLNNIAVFYASTDNANVTTVRYLLLDSAGNQLGTQTTSQAFSEANVGNAWVASTLSTANNNYAILRETFALDANNQQISKVTAQSINGSTGAVTNGFTASPTTEMTDIGTIRYTFAIANKAVFVLSGMLKQPGGGTAAGYQVLVVDYPSTTTGGTVLSSMTRLFDDGKVHRVDVTTPTSGVNNELVLSYSDLGNLDIDQISIDTTTNAITAGSGVSVEDAGAAGRVSRLGDGRILVEWTKPFLNGDGIATSVREYDIFDTRTAGLNVNLSATTTAQWIAGTTLLDTITATNLADHVDGNAGDDTINGGGGDDDLRGGAGVDNLNGGDNSDTLDGGDGNDIINGGNGTDTMMLDFSRSAYTYTDIGGVITFTSLVDGEVDTATLVEQFTFLGAGQVLTSAQLAMSPVTLDGSANIGVFGGATNDLIDALGGNDVVYSVDGYDTVLGGLGNDVLVMGNGDDTAAAGADNDYVYGGAGNDVILGEAGGDVLLGDNDDDDIYGGAEGDYLFGGNGSDVLYGGLGVDIMYGNDGDDELNGDEDRDYFYGGQGSDLLTGGDGSDVFITVGENVGQTIGDLIDGGNGADYVYASDTTDAIYGGADVDVIQAFAGDDSIEGGAGVDYIYGGTGNDTFHLRPGANSDLIYDFTPHAGGANGDTVRISGVPWTTFAEVQLAMFFSAPLGTTIVTLPGGSNIWLIGVAPAQLTSADFVLPS